jgi:hypothetical protein
MNFLSGTNASTQQHAQKKYEARVALRYFSLSHGLKCTIFMGSMAIGEGPIIAGSSYWTILLCMCWRRERHRPQVSQGVSQVRQIHHGPCESSLEYLRLEPRTVEKIIIRSAEGCFIDIARLSLLNPFSDEAS